MPGQPLGHPHQLGIGRLLKRRYTGGNGGEINFYLMALGQRLQFATDDGPQRVGVHARQRPQVEFQRALATNPVGVVAAMDATKVQGRLRYAELRVAVFVQPLLAQPLELGDRVVHGVQLVGSGHDFLSRNITADHRRTPQRPACFNQGPGAGHRSFFVTGGEDQQRLLERLVEQRAYGFDHQREKTLHVATAQADPAVIHFCQLERIGLPQRFIVRHGIAVPGQHQPAGACAKAGEQVEFAGADLLDIAVETQVAQPGGQ